MASGPPITWNPSMSVGDQRLDDEHRELIDIVNLIGDKVASDRAAEAGGLINQLLNAARVHFRNEERELRENGFPDAPHHAREHQRLMDQAVMLAGLVERNEITPRVMQLLHAWLVEHLFEHDRAYAAFMQERRSV